LEQEKKALQVFLAYLIGIIVFCLWHTSNILLVYRKK
jgi:hypothetical protein